MNLNRVINKKTVFLMSCIKLLLIAGVIPAAAVPADTERGKKIFADKCAVCHGTHGDGNSPMTKLFPKKPTDYTDKAQMEKVPDAELKKTIREGKRPMPKWDGRLTEQDIDDVIAYIRSLGK